MIGLTPYYIEKGTILLTHVTQFKIMIMYVLIPNFVNWIMYIRTIYENSIIILYINKVLCVNLTKNIDIFVTDD